MYKSIICSSVILIIVPSLHISLSLHSSTEFFSTLLKAETLISGYSESLPAYKTILERNGVWGWAS